MISTAMMVAGIGLVFYSKRRLDKAAKRLEELLNDKKIK
jgi:hypothetical protein